MLRDLSVRLFSGSATQLAMHALAMEQASPNELEEIRALIDRKRVAGQSSSNGKEQK
jgi:BlaI family transcriptional regulator, penicillinase repressor